MGLIASKAVPQQATKSNTQINSFTVRNIIGPKALAVCMCGNVYAFGCVCVCVCVYFLPNVYACALV